MFYVVLCSFGMVWYVVYVLCSLWAGVLVVVLGELKKMKYFFLFFLFFLNPKLKKKWAAFPLAPPGFWGGFEVNVPWPKPQNQHHMYHL